MAIDNLSHINIFQFKQRCDRSCSGSERCRLFFRRNRLHSRCRGMRKNVRRGANPHFRNICSPLLTMSISSRMTSMRQRSLLSIALAPCKLFTYSLIYAINDFSISHYSIIHFRKPRWALRKIPIVSNVRNNVNIYMKTDLLYLFFFFLT